MPPKMAKRIVFTAADRKAADSLMEVHNIGPATAHDLLRLEVRTPAALAKQDPDELYDRLCRLTNARQDPCVRDTFAAAIWCARTGRSKPWWTFTPERKRAWAAAGRDQSR